MANVINGNTIYIDTAGTITTNKNEKVVYIILTTSSAGGLITFSDPSLSGNPTKFTLKNAVDEDSKLFDFSTSPLIFPNGIRVETLTGATALVVFSRQGG